MKNLKIFIASSADYIEKDKNGDVDVEASNQGRLKPIIQGLKEAGFTPIPWWNSIKVFNSGKPFLENLIDASKKFDGGIFVFGKDVEISENNPLQATHIPNSNVLLEAGMFYAAKGIERTFIVIDKDYESHVKIHIPSDIGGFMVNKLTAIDLKEKIKDFFNLTIKIDKYDKVTFYIGKEISEDIIERKYFDWKSKSLYIGTESARLWNDIEGHDSYNKNVEVIPGIIEQIKNKKLMDFRNIDNIVSFGSGNGISDNTFLENVIEANDSLCYVPIDINPMMICHASRNIDRTIRIPFALIDDFEENVDHIENIINGKVHDIGKKNFFIMLGVTFSNLEGSEQAFFNKIKKWMDPDDYFLIDVSINSDNDLNNLTEQVEEVRYKKLLHNSILNRQLIDISTTLNNIKFIAKEIEEPDLKNNYTKILNTKVYCYKYEGKIIFISKRYNFVDIEAKFRRAFNVLLAEEVESESKRKKAFFMFKLKPKKIS